MSLPVNKRSIDETACYQLIQELRLNPVIARILVGRNISTPNAARSFLSPSPHLLHDPYLLPGMRVAVERLNQALDSGETILVHGDYDADGLTSTALLTQAFAALGAKTKYFIPNRLDEGYGLNREGVEHALSTGAKLIVTCDCGTSSREEVDYALSLGIDTIITDHHEPELPLPEAVAIVNPKLPDSDYPFRGLAGVGVASKLVMALMESRGKEPPLQNLLRICAIGTIADVVPLVDENRFIAHSGLLALPGTPNVGLRELFRVAGLETNDISSEDIGFRIAPRLNATGRFGKHELAMRLLFTRSSAEARRIAAEMNDLNSKRQRMVDVMVSKAIEYVEARQNFKKEKIIVVADSGWHKGLVGLVASKLVERYGVPALAGAIEDEIVTGSGRSIEAFNLIKNLAGMHSLFNRFGGHAQACGFELPVARLSELRENLLTIAAKALPESVLEEIYQVDASIDLDHIDDSFSLQYKKLEPFGNGNELPLLHATDLRLSGAPQLLKEKHLKLKLRQEKGTKEFFALFWNAAERYDELLSANRLEAVFSIMFNRWRGNEEIQLNLRDIAIQ